MAIVLMWFFFIVCAIGLFSLFGKIILGACHVLGKVLPVVIGVVVAIAIIVCICMAIAVA